MENNEAKKNGAWSAIGLVLLLVLVAGYALTFGLQTLAWIAARRSAAQNSWLREVPKPVATSAAQTAGQPAAQPPAHPQGNELRAYDYEFTVPWPSKYKTTPSLMGTQFNFDSGQVVFVYNPEAQLDTVKALQSSGGFDYQRFEIVFAGQSLETNYALYQAVYGASPDQLSPFMNARDAMRLGVLLNWKLSFGRDAGPGSYSLNFGANRGFQFGDPSKGAAAVRIFTTHDKQFRFIFAAAGGSNAKITQDDINAALQSFRPVPIIGDEPRTLSIRR